MEFVKEYKIYFIVGGIITLIILGLFSSYILKKEELAPPELYAEVVEINDETFFVDVKGAVKKPGVYAFVDGDRVIDAINAAGGLTKNGNTSNINLSQKLTSEMMVYVFNNTEIKSGSNSSSCSTICETNVINVGDCSTDEAASKININTATLEEIMSLPGIGEAKAKTIIDYRKEQGNFESIDDLKKVSGIGENTFNSLKDLITV